MEKKITGVTYYYKKQPEWFITCKTLKDATKCGILVLLSNTNPLYRWCINVSKNINAL